MANITFTLGSETFTFGGGRRYPLHDPDVVNVVTGYTEGRQLYAYDKGVAEKLFSLDFVMLDATDYAAFTAFFTDVAVGPKHSFTFTDEGGTDHTVRMLDTENPLREVSSGRFSGVVRLREEVA